MTDREIKEALREAYSCPETDREKRFLRMHQRRSLHLGAILKMELRYMGVRSLFTGIVLCLLLLGAVKSGDIDTVWTISAFLPVGAFVPMALLRRSERFGMQELEAASRFSLRFVRLVRMLILGLASLILLLSVSLILKTNLGIGGTELLLVAFFPYLSSVLGGLMVTRVWHRQENLLGIGAVCTLCGLLPHLIREWNLPDGMYLMLFAALILALARESTLFVKESENVIWNLC